jgi:hypothetical protein
VTIAITVAIADAELATRVRDAAARAVARATAELVLDREPRAVRFRSRARLAAVRDELPGALALIGVTPRNARRLRELVDGARAAACAGVQLVWDGADRMRIEGPVFEVLEHARATPDQAPVVLAASAHPAAALLQLMAHRERRDRS